MEMSLIAKHYKVCRIKIITPGTWESDPDLSGADSSGYKYKRLNFGT